ncbi:hypothetical protein J6590_078928, partial [Homalodisca vitripennis]
VFKDKNTPSPYIEDLKALGDTGESQGAAKTDHVYMDAMAFGMGCCCLQLTFQACNIKEARILYDQLTPLCPILLALTAASPVHRGMLTDVDCRWTVISGSVDCRTREERGLDPLCNNKFVIPKSRYDSIDSYLSEQGEPHRLKSETWPSTGQMLTIGINRVELRYNDVPLIYDPAIYQRLKSAGIDHLLAQHVAHLFIRDTVSLFSEKVDQDDTVDSDHFENIQSTNWQTMRFKPPPPNSKIGWRVEFRPCEVQLTDFENAAIVCFVVLLTRVILSYQLNFIIPISKVDENMSKAQKNNALHKELFHFRKDITTQDTPPQPRAQCQSAQCGANCAPVYTAMSIDQIVNGKKGEFPGLIPLIENYLSSMDVDADTHCTIQQYLKLIQRRASGELLTTAAWIRKFVTTHPDYKHDSVVSDSINYDLLKTAVDIQKGKIRCSELLGQSNISKTQESIPSAMKKIYPCV